MQLNRRSFLKTAAAAAGAHVITLGPRILRTETAGMAVLAMCTLMMEE